MRLVSQPGLVMLLTAAPTQSHAGEKSPAALESASSWRRGCTRAHRAHKECSPANGPGLRASRCALPHTQYTRCTQRSRLAHAATCINKHRLLSSIGYVVVACMCAVSARQCPPRASSHHSPAGLDTAKQRAPGSHAASGTQQIGSGTTGASQRGAQARTPQAPHAHTHLCAPPAPSPWRPLHAEMQCVFSAKRLAPQGGQ